ncbi:DnaJ domain-containing protein [Biscogniauxia sp. FL1348]|nr:DnaJ domain-containing protein [Biscogniauxia sp. FL1348]
MGSTGNSAFRADLYAILNVPRDASHAAIRNAYRTLSRRYHPDKQSTSSVASHDRFVWLQRAYEILYDPAKRQEYDQPTTSTHPPQPPSNIHHNNPPATEAAHQPQPQPPTRGKESLVAPLEQLWGLYEQLKSLLLPRPSRLASSAESRCLAKLEGEIWRRRDDWVRLRDAIARRAPRGWSCSGGCGRASRPWAARTRTARAGGGGRGALGAGLRLWSRSILTGRRVGVICLVARR